MSRRLFVLFIAALLMLGGAVRAQEPAIADVLRVVETLPSQSAIDVPTDGVITIIFNRPVVALTAVEAMDALPDPLVFIPAVRGRGEWLNSAIYTFRAEPALAGSTDYTLQLDPSLTAIDGASAEPFSLSFTTVAPAVTRVLPEPGGRGDVRIDTRIQVTFNMPMDRASTEADFFLREDGGTTRVAGTFEWSDDSTGLSFRPQQQLALATSYAYGFSGAAQGAGGGALGESLMWRFQTIPLPGVVRTDPFDGQTNAPLYGLNIFFASPMNPETFEDRISIEPEPWRTPDFYYSDYDNSLTLSFPIEPSADYTITLEAGAEDIFGNAIAQPFAFSFTTAPFGPDLRLEAPMGVGFYNASSPRTQLYLNHTNLSQIDLSLYRVDPGDVLPLFVGPNSYDPTYSFTPRAQDLLRNWSIRSVAPENARRYELLDLGAAASGLVECPGAPPSRITPGDSARVITDPDPVRARATPGTGAIVTLLYRDYALTITGGPECVDGLLWWQVRLRDGQDAWVAEGVQGEYFIEPLGAAQAAPSLETTETGALPPGIYFLSANAPELRSGGYQGISHFLIVGSANLTLKTSIDSALVWATDVTTGLPIADAPITIFDSNYRVAAEGRTDADGLLRAALPRADNLYTPQMAVLNDGRYFGVGANNWSAGIESYDFGLPLETQPEPFRAYVYTDRPVYRPGQPVYFRGVVRARDDVQYSLPSLSEIPVQVFGGDDGALLYEATLPLTPFGTFSGQFDLGDDAPLGFYRLVANLPRENPDEQYFGIEGTIGFSVAQYRLPEYQVSLTAEATQVGPQDTIRVEMESRYFFGGAVSDAAVTYSVVAQPYFYSPDGASNYSFVDFNYDYGASETFGANVGVIASGEGRTDASGRLTIEIPVDMRDATQSLTYTIEATVTDESSQAVSGRVDVIVNKAYMYVGVRPQEYVSTVGQETAVDLLVLDWGGTRLDGATIDVEVVERRWSSVQQEDDAGRTVWSWEVEDIPVTSGSVVSVNGAAQFAFTPPAGGVYKVIARTRDNNGNEAIASTNLWVSSPEYVSWRQQNSNRIELVTDQDDYLIGDTAEILIASPFQGSAEALVTVERGDVLFSERITLEGNSTVYRLPILPDYAPNVYVSVLIVKGVDENNPVAAFRMGMATLSVERSRREITLAITPDREDAGPGDTVTYTVRATDYNGDPLRAEIGVGLTDLASLSIAPPNSISILDYYFGVQSLGVRTSTALTINVDQLTQEIIDTIKGGGGGFGEGGIFDIRQEFVDTAFWDGALLTNENGEATFTVTLPDNLTTWRLDARAVTRGDGGETLVGQETFDLISTKPLLIRPVTPRFFVAGDEAVVAAVLNNNTEQPLTVDVHLQIGTADQAVSSSPLMQTVTLAAGGRSRVEWSLQVGSAPDLALVFLAQAQDADFQDASMPPLGRGDAQTLPIYRYDAPETVATAGALAAGASVTETISIPPELGATSAEARISVQPSLVASALRSLEASVLPPNASTEQIISSFLPDLMLNRVLVEAGIQDAVLQSRVSANIQRGLQALTASQRVDGGWGWYSRDVSDPGVSAYALIGLSAARADGYPVSSAMIERAQAYLRAQTAVPGLNMEVWQLNRQAFILYALAFSGQPYDARMATLYESRQSLALWARGLLAQALALRDPADPRASALLDALASAAVLSATGTHWEESVRDPYNWNTDTRTTAIVLNVLLQQRPQSALIPNVVRWLVSARRSDVWETSQETSWSLMAIARYIAVTGDIGLTAQAAVDVTSVMVDGEAVALSVDVGDAAIASVPAPTDTPSTIDIENSGAGTLYYTAQLDLTLPMANVGALNRGIIVERRYTTGEDDALRTVTGGIVGELVTVRVTIIAPSDLHYVVIEDPFPAGAEAINPELSTSQQVGTRPQLSRENPLSQGWGWWWFGSISFRDEKAVLSATTLPAGTYEFVYTLRLGLAGSYQVLPTMAREAYFPEVFGRSAGAVFTIRDGE